MILDKRLIIGNYPLFFERFGNTSNTTGTRVYVNSVSRVRIPPCPPYIAVYDDFINGLFLCRKCYYDTYYDIFIICHGFFTIKKNLIRKVGTITYKGWTLLNWSDEINKNRWGLPQRFIFTHLSNNTSPRRRDILYRDRSSPGNVRLQSLF